MLILCGTILVAVTAFAADGAAMQEQERGGLVTDTNLHE